VPARLEAEMLFSQTCGYPLETVFKGQALRLGAPVYDTPGLTVSPTGTCALAIARARLRAVRELRRCRSKVRFGVARAVSRTMLNHPLNPEEQTSDAQPRAHRCCPLYLAVSMRRNSRVIALIWARYIATS
jgi:hypothetical protein